MYTQHLDREAFYDVMGERALSFPDLSLGETAARPLFFSGRTAEGVKDPPRISPKKRPARKPQTEEKASLSSPYYYETLNTT